MRFFLGVVAALVLLAHGGHASAQHPLVRAKLEELNAKAPQPPAAQIKEALSATAKAMGAAKGICVPTDVEIGDIAAITGARAVLQAVLSGDVRNAWTVYATHGGCSGAEIYRYMVVQKSDGSLLAPLVNEGRTLANPSVMRDTSASAALAALHNAKTLDSTCSGETMEMGPTRVSSQSPDLGPEIFGARYVGSWSEIWRFNVCGRSYDVPVDFTADGDGGAYTNIKGAEVAAVE